jgi:PKD repeat protein
MTHKVRTLLLFCSLALFLSIIIVGPASAINGDAWADDMTDWGYRVPITITDAPTAAGVQRMITLTYQDEMQADFDDIRFYTSDGSSIDYWIEEKTDSAYANVWVKLPSADMLYIYAYYGNDLAIDAGDNDVVFEFYDDFDTLDSDVWVHNYHTGTFFLSSGNLNCDAYGYYSGIQTKKEFDNCDNLRVVCKVTETEVHTLFGMCPYESSTSGGYRTGPYNPYFLTHFGSLGLLYSDIDHYTSHDTGTSKDNNRLYVVSNVRGGAIDLIYVIKVDSAATTFSIGTPEELPSGDVISYPGYGTNPTDPDTDGLYEDVNGNSRLDFQDIMIFFQYNAWAQANQPNVSCFDWSGNGAIEFSDVQLFWEKEFT